MHWVKFLPTIFIKYFIITTYTICKILFPVQKKKITFASYRSEQLVGNLYYMFEELKRRDQAFRFTFLFKRYHSSFFGKLDYVFHMVRASYHLATSRFFLIDDYYLPVYFIKPRKNTEIIQLWHASGALKKFGYSTIGKSFGPSKEYLKHVKIHSNYSYVFVASKQVIPFYAEAFNMPKERIKPLGIPRTDFFFDKNKHEEIKKLFYSYYPETKNKKIILYAPTYRGKSHYQNHFELPFDLYKFKKQLGDHYVLLIHLHPYMKSDLKLDETQWKHFAYLIEKPFTIHELMIVSDLLISDYSTVIFEYSLLHKPIAFIANDLEDYLAERDFYYDYLSFIPGPFFSDQEHLLQWIVKEKYDLQKIHKFRQKHLERIDGQSSKRIADFLLNKEKNEIATY